MLSHCYISFLYTQHPGKSKQLKGGRGRRERVKGGRCRDVCMVIQCTMHLSLSHAYVLDISSCLGRNIFTLSSA